MTRDDPSAPRGDLVGIVEDGLGLGLRRRGTPRRSRCRPGRRGRPARRVRRRPVPAGWRAGAVAGARPRPRRAGAPPRRRRRGPPPRTASPSSAAACPGAVSHARRWKNSALSRSPSASATWPRPTRAAAVHSGFSVTPASSCCAKVRRSRAAARSPRWRASSPSPTAARGLPSAPSCRATAWDSANSCSARSASPSSRVTWPAPARAYWTVLAGPTSRDAGKRALVHGQRLVQPAGAVQRHAEVELDGRHTPLVAQRPEGQQRPVTDRGGRVEVTDAGVQLQPDEVRQRRAPGVAVPRELPLGLGRAPRRRRPSPDCRWPRPPPGCPTARRGTRRRAPANSARLCAAAAAHSGLGCTMHAPGRAATASACSARARAADEPPDAAASMAATRRPPSGWVAKYQYQPSEPTSRSPVSGSVVPRARCTRRARRRCRPARAPAAAATGPARRRAAPSPPARRGR